MTEFKKPKCPKCGWSNIRHRIRDNSYHCEHCGHVWPKEEK